MEPADFGFQAGVILCLLDNTIKMYTLWSQSQPGMAIKYLEKVLEQASYRIASAGIHFPFLTIHWVTCVVIIHIIITSLYWSDTCERKRVGKIKKKRLFICCPYVNNLSLNGERSNQYERILQINHACICVCK